MNADIKNYTNIEFFKLHGLGNDVIVVFKKYDLDYSRLAIDMCNRHTGVGADSFMVVEPPSDGGKTFKVSMIDWDGTPSGMCCNGIRCVCRTLLLMKYVDENQEFELNADGRILRAVCLKKYRDIKNPIRVDQGIINFTCPEIPVRSNHFMDIPIKTQLGVLNWITMSLGNPHAVTFLPDEISLNNIAGTDIPREVEYHPIFPERANVSFVRLHPNNEIEVRTWERGTGWTKACGSGACASAVATILKHHFRSPVRVCFELGNMWVEWKGDLCKLDAHLVQIGPAQEVFRGEYGYYSSEETLSKRKDILQVAK